MANQAQPSAFSRFGRGPTAPRIDRRRLLAAAVGAACLPLARVHVATAAAQSGESPQRGGTLRGACVAAITSLDPATSKLGVADNVVFNALYNTLVRTTLTGEVVAELATSWEISPDGLAYTFELRPGVTFHDGTPLDAAAVQFNLDRYRAPGSAAPAAEALKVVDRVEVLGPQTVRIVLRQPSAPLLVQLGGSAASIGSPTAVRELGADFPLRGVGSGPFRFASWTPGDAATFVRADNYWEQGVDGQPLPYLDEVIVNGVPDESVRLLNLRSGQFELNERLNPRDVPAAERDQSVRLVETATATCYLVAMNVTAPPFDNKALRQAVSAAVNRQAIIENIGFGVGYTTPMPFPRDAWFFVEGPSPTYDPTLVAQKLQEAGLADGLTVTMSIINRPVDQQIAQIVKANLDEVGIATTVEVLERTAWVDRWSARQGQLGILQRGASPTDPSDQAVFFSPTNLANFAGYQNERISGLVDEANRTTDQAERKRLWEEITGLMVDDAAYVSIGAVPVIGAAAPGVRDLTVDPTSAWILSRAWTAT